MCPCVNTTPLHIFKTNNCVRARAEHTTRCAPTPLDLPNDSKKKGNGPIKCQCFCI